MSWLGPGRSQGGHWGTLKELTLALRELVEEARAWRAYLEATRPVPLQPGTQPDQSAVTYRDAQLLADAEALAEEEYGRTGRRPTAESLLAQLEARTGR